LISPVLAAMMLSMFGRLNLSSIYEFKRAKNFDRDVEASVVPIGTKVTLQKGETAHITQSLGGSYTVVVNGNMFRIADKDADALGLEVPTQPPPPRRPAARSRRNNSKSRSGRRSRRVTTRRFPSTSLTSA
jgi:hypothetical protein